MPKEKSDARCRLISFSCSPFLRVFELEHACSVTATLINPVFYNLEFLLYARPQNRTACLHDLLKQ